MFGSICQFLKPVFSFIAKKSKKASTTPSVSADHGGVPAGFIARFNTKQQWRFQFNQAVALYRQGDKFGDNAALAKAIDAYRRCLALAPRPARPLDCAVTDRKGTLLAIRSSDTNEDGWDKTEFSSDAARPSELIAIAKAWTTSFSNSEIAVDSRGVGLASRIDDHGPETFGNKGRQCWARTPLGRMGH